MDCNKNDNNSPFESNQNEENQEVRRGASRPDLCNEDVRAPAAEESQRREENPFSFKRFLNQDSRGARRKEYSPDGTPILHTPEMSSVLPDFVQDHLVVEQCYLSSPQHHVPYDLPGPAEDRVDPTVAMSLPDFLSDGPIHNQRCEGEAAGYQTCNKTDAANGHVHSSSSFARNDSDRLLREIDNLRRQLQERSRRVQVLESEIALLHSRDARETDSLEQALQQVENNLRQTSRQMAAAEKTVLKLKAENKMLKTRLETMEGSACGPSASSSHHSSSHNSRLAQDLRGAASAAEVHVRALMSGIENLKLLANSVDDSPTFDFNDVGAPGPAL